MPQPMSTPTAAGMIAPCGNHAAHSSADTPMHVGHRRHPLVDEGQLRNVQKLLTCSIFQRDPLGPGLDRYAVFLLDYVVSCVCHRLFLKLALHGCRPWVIPLYEPPKGEPTRAPDQREQLARAQRFTAGPSKNWGEMRESNSRSWSHNPVPKPFGQSRHQNVELVE